MNTWDAIVIGAGPAGSAAAAVLASGNARVLFVEKDRFPREKVCGEFLSGDALSSLERIGARRAVESVCPERIERGSVHPARGPGVRFILPAPALGISRWRLDDLLAAQAQKAGAQLRSSTRVVSFAGSPQSGFAVRFASAAGEEEAFARAVIGAWGRWDALDRRLGRGFLARARFFGWSRDYGGDTSALAGSVRLYFFPGGYCGLSRVEGGAANLAGVLSEKARRKIGGTWEDVVRCARKANPALDADLSAMELGSRGFLGTVPVVFTAKPATEDGILMAGDAAGVLDPFSGQGQAAAMASGILAGETALAFTQGRIPAGEFLPTYERAWRSRFARPFAWSALLRRLVLEPTLGALAGRLAGERLVRLAIRELKTENKRLMGASGS